MDLAEILRIAAENELDTYARRPVALERGEGAFVFDGAGGRYLDFFAQHAVAIAGHAPPSVVAAIREQAGRLIACTNAFHSPPRAELLAELRAFAEPTQPQLTRAFLCNSGAEAVENALKLARKATGRPGIVAVQRSFHGRTLAALSVTSAGPYRSQHGPLPGDVSFVEVGELAELDAALTQETAAVILEPIQGVGGVRVPNVAWCARLAELCAERGVVLIADEIQTGLGRTGRPFGADTIGLAPQIVTLGKGLGSGVAIGALLTTDALAATVKLGEYGSTFGGNPIASAAAVATLRLVREQDLAGNAARMGERLTAALIRMPAVAEVKGAGLMLGAVLDRSAKGVGHALFDAGIIAGTCADPHMLRILPPLTVGEPEVDAFVDALTGVLHVADASTVAMPAIRLPPSDDDAR